MFRDADKIVMLAASMLILCAWVWMLAKSIFDLQDKLDAYENRLEAMQVDIDNCDEEIESVISFQVELADKIDKLKADPVAHLRQGGDR